MMIHQQQPMISSPIKPMSQQPFTNRRTSRDKQQRSVMFCSSTKDVDTASKRSSGLKKHRASSAVPIPHAMFRSPSEVQLLADERVADERDFVFYARLVSGIQERRMMTNNDSSCEETERCLTHIMQTRHEHGDKLEDDGVPIVSNNDGDENGGYYFEDRDSFVCSSSSYSSSSTYQQEFEQDSLHQEEDECIFDLELWRNHQNGKRLRVIFHATIPNPFWITATAQPSRSLETILKNVI